MILICSGKLWASERPRYGSFEEERSWPQVVERYEREGRLDLAQKEAESAIEENPLDVGALLLAARINMARLQWADAEERLRAAARLGARGEVTRLLMEVLSRQGKSAEAELAPVDEVPGDMRGLIAKMTPQNAREAMVELNRQRARGSHQALYWVARARAFRLMERPREALSALNRSLALDPDLDVARFEAARFWERRGRLNRAAEHLSYLVMTHPENARAAYRLVRLHLLRNRPDLAAQVLRVRQYLFPSEEWVANARARIAEHAKALKGPAFLGSCKRHTVAPGDTLQRIAQLYLGDANRWLELQRSRSGEKLDPLRLPIGLEIDVCTG